MYSYTWDSETGGLLLNSSPLRFSKEPRPVYSTELDILGFDKYWEYNKDDSTPIMWAEANNYIYRGKLVASVKGGSFFTAPKIQIIDNPENGGKLKVIDVPTMISKNKEIMDALVADTIKEVYNTYMNFKSKVDIFHVSYSGGKDSEVTLDIIQRALPHNSFVVIFGNTGMEFPDTYKSVELAKKKCEANGIRFYIAKSHFNPTESWRKFGPPSSVLRWCCTIHKTTPQLLLIRNILEKNSITEMAFVGVRADESVRRSGYEYISYGTKQKGQYSCNPILFWNSAEVYLYILANGLHLNDAYRRGNTRVGCLVCPMSTNRNDYFNNLCYPENTKPLLDIIHELNCTYKGDESQLKSYIENNGWKARKNGRDLSISPKDYDETIVDSNLVISLKNRNNNLWQWLKTIGRITHKNFQNEIVIESGGAFYQLNIVEKDNDYIQIVVEYNNSPATTLFLKKLKFVCRKTHYCAVCKVCMTNCKYGNIVFDNNGKLFVSDNCTRCGQCLEIDSGCYVYKSLWLSKGLGNMNTRSKSIDCYAAHGPKMEWFQQFVKLGERFKSENTLGNNQIPAFNRFLRDAGIITSTKNNRLAIMLSNNIQNEIVWALMLTNLVYSPEVGWYIRNFNTGEIFGQSSIVNKLSSIETVSASALKSIPAALKRIALLPFNKVGFGIVEKSNKMDGGAKFMRTPWVNPEPKVILYSLYKYAEACGGYYQFTLSRLYDKNIESEGVSPAKIFGISKENIKKILIGLSTNYSEFISSTFTLDLDNINLNKDKKSEDILDLF